MTGQGRKRSIGHEKGQAAPRCFDGVVPRPASQQLGERWIPTVGIEIPCHQQRAALRCHVCGRLRLRRSVPPGLRPPGSDWLRVPPEFGVTWSFTSIARARQRHRRPMSIHVVFWKGRRGRRRQTPQRVRRPRYAHGTESAPSTPAATSAARIDARRDLDEHQHVDVMGKDRRRRGRRPRAILVVHIGSQHPQRRQLSCPRR